MLDTEATKKHVLPDDLLAAITECAREFDVRVVWLFGSMLTDPGHARDIDLAVEGLDPDKYFDLYSKLWDVLPKPIDLVDLSEEPPIAPIVREEGVRIYER